ncbi:MFS transporter [Pseudomonas sp. zfem004]|uniref:MFS transporter n=1 Tax=Pseudomonas sp. zfem004 TaxID=3078199 RepID=UPI002927DE41|nr:MFS transporter [Pseudomonas sp. zfem004]MDU9404252.1 MFS transporter [Pseudomonas sp. zfem004]
MLKLLASYFTTATCSWVIAFLIPLYIYEQTGSPVWTSSAYLVAIAPYILVTPFAGAWSDRFSKRLLLVGGDLLSLVTGLVLYAALQLLSGLLLCSVLLLLTFLLTSVRATHHPAFQSIAPSIIEKGRLHTFNAVVNASDNMIRIAAPLGVAAALTLTSKDQLLILAVLGFAISLPLCYQLEERHKPQPTSRPILREISTGFSYVIENKQLRALVTLFFFCNFGFALIGASLVYLYTSILAVPSTQLGYYYGLIGCGAVAGSLLGAMLAKRCQAGALIRHSCLLAGLFTLAGAFTQTPWSLSAFWALSTCCQSVVVIAFFTYRQQTVPQAILGRTVGVTRLIAYLAIPPASLLSGWLLLHFSSSALVLASGGICITLASLLAYSGSVATQPSLEP